MIFTPIKGLKCLNKFNPFTLAKHQIRKQPKTPHQSRGCQLNMRTPGTPPHKRISIHPAWYNGPEMGLPASTTEWAIAVDQLPLSKKNRNTRGF